MLFAIVTRGKKTGTRLLPHRFKDHRYHVRLGKQGPYIPVADDRDIPLEIIPNFEKAMHQLSLERVCRRDLRK